MPRSASASRSNSRQPPTSSLRPSPTAEQFLAQPVGRYVLGEHHLVWSASPTLAGTVFWDRAREAECKQVTALWDYEARLAIGYDSIVDLQHLTGVEPAAFGVVAEDLRRRLPRLAQAVRRQALVRPAGMTGAIVAGFYPTLEPGHEWRDFTDAAEAFAWIGADVAVAVEIRELVEGARQAGELVSRLRQALAADPIRSLEALARSLASSTRTLQRVLQHAGSSFRAEVQRARLARARDLLVESDMKIEAIAREVGCGSASTLITLFRRVHGETPDVFRRRHRA